MVFGCWVRWLIDADLQCCRWDGSLLYPRFSSTFPLSLNVERDTVLVICLKTRIVILCLIVLLSLFVSVPCSVAASPGQDWIYDSIHDRVSVSNNQYSLSVWPATTSGGWVYLNFTSNSFKGLANLVFGFDSTLHKVSAFDLYDPHDVYSDFNVTLKKTMNLTWVIESYNLVPVDPSHDYGKSMPNLGIYTKGTLVLFHSNRGKNLTKGQEITFDYFNENSGLVKYHSTKHFDWDSWKKSNISSSVFRYQGMSQWHQVGTVDVKKNTMYYMRVFVDILPSQKGEVGEWWIGLKPIGKSILDSVKEKSLMEIDPWWNSTFPYKVKLTIDHTKIDADLTNFPELVYFTSAWMNWSNVQDDLDDFRFVDSTEATLLDAELESYTVNDKAWIHVRLHSVSYIVDTDFYAYFGNPTASSAWNPEGVWDSNFVMVQHMTDNPDTSHIKDSTSNANNGLKYASGDPAQTAGQMGPAQDFDGANTIGSYIKILDASNLRLTTAFTISVWVKTNDMGAGYGKGIFTKGLRVNLGSLEEYEFNLVSGIPYFGYHTAPGDYYQSWMYVNVADDVWHQLTITFTNWYLDGALIRGTGFSVTPQQMNLDCFIGAIAPPAKGGDGASNFLEAVVDSLRFSQGINRPLAWAKAEYYSGLDGLLAYGSSTHIQLPSIGQFQTMPIVYPNKPIFFNETGSYDLGHGYIQNMSLEMNAVVLGWDRNVSYSYVPTDPYSNVTSAANWYAALFSEKPVFTASGEIASLNGFTAIADFRNIVVPDGNILIYLLYDSVSKNYDFRIVRGKVEDINFIAIYLDPGPVGYQWVEGDIGYTAYLKLIYSGNLLKVYNLVNELIWSTTISPSRTVGYCVIEEEGADLPTGFSTLLLGENSHFFKITDPHNYFNLNATGSILIPLNATAYKTSWRGSFLTSYPEGYIDAIPVGTKIWTTDGLSASNGREDWFLFTVPPSSVSLAAGAFLALIVLPLLLIVIWRRRH